MIKHPEVAVSRCTRFAAPEAYEGELLDGRHFIFRYRLGRASLAVGSSRTTVDSQRGTVVAHGAAMQGCFSTKHERDLVFAELFKLFHAD